MDKESLRESFKFARSALNRRFVANKSFVISSKLLRFVKSYSFIASYCPVNNEVNPNLRLNKKLLYFPKINRRDMYMMSLKNSSKKGFGGIMEPFGYKNRAFKNKIQAIIVPAVAFDVKGYRVGYGKGFYDRFLKGFKGLKIGVAYDCYVVKNINHDFHDIAVDIVVTEKRNIICKLRR
jgi:5-formyltetrahydrofolate cyclo-ligase